MSSRTCPSCDAEVPRGEQTCNECGEPLPYAPDEASVACRVCGAEITAYTERCPECGETGYPALRPRKGGHFEGAPEPDDRSGGEPEPGG